jgi:hypothetical protein
VVARPCEVSCELVESLDSVHGPFVARGLRGKKSTPSIGWEVPVKSHRSARESCKEHGPSTKSGRLGNNTPSLFMRDRMLV